RTIVCASSTVAPPPAVRARTRPISRAAEFISTGRSAPSSTTTPTCSASSAERLRLGGRASGSLSGASTTSSSPRPRRNFHSTASIVGGHLAYRRCAQALRRLLFTAPAPSVHPPSTSRCLSFWRHDGRAMRDEYRADLVEV